MSHTYWSMWTKPRFTNVASPVPSFFGPFQTKSAFIPIRERSSVNVHSYEKLLPFSSAAKLITVSQLAPSVPYIPSMFPL